MKTALLVAFLFLLIPAHAFAQSDQVFLKELSEGWKLGNPKVLARLLDDKVEITNNGKEKSYSRDEATAELHRFFGTNQPVNFNLKHSGTSADGQVYLIGRLDTQSGKNYRIMCRARSWQSGYQIFKLDMDGGN